MSNLVIVALPPEDERASLVSSEKQAHMTLLFLGPVDKVENLSTIIDFVQHAASLMTRFNLSVARRGPLGVDSADVLFFDNYYRWDFKLIQDFRNQLLQNDAIKAAVESVDQHPEWTPHLTMGYPSTPAKKDDREWPIRNVDFDRIAIWTEDLAGPEIVLPWDREMDILAMTDPVAAFLRHHGVKGMKWGVRKARSAQETFHRNTATKLRKEGAALAESHMKLGGSKKEAQELEAGHNMVADKHEAKANKIAERNKPVTKVIDPDSASAKSISQKKKKSGLDSLSNDEIQALTRRLSLEKQLKDLDQGGAQGKGKKLAKEILGDIGKQHMKKLAAKAATKAVGAALS